jgi:hypothetical protein
MRALKRPVGLLVVAALVGGFGAVQAAMSPVGAAACADVIMLRTMTIHIKPVTQNYKVGSIASVPVVVTRPANTDPAQLGVPVPTAVSEPASNVTIGIGLHIGPVFSPGYAITDSNGGASVKIKIPTYAPAATVNIDAYAYNILVQAPCYTIQEDGYTRKMAVFKTTK